MYKKWFTSVIKKLLKWAKTIGSTEASISMKNNKHSSLQNEKKF